MRSTTMLGRAAALVALALAAGCGGQSGSAPEAGPAGGQQSATISVATLTAGQDVPAPAKDGILTVTGGITRTNRMSTLVLDLDTLERLGVQQVRLFEPWVKQSLEFRGVWLADVLKVAGTPAGATKVHLVAHDDYTVDLTMAEIRAGGVLVATRSGVGEPLPVDNGGPTRLVFLDGVSAGANPDRWIWSLKSIDVS